MLDRPQWLFGLFIFFHFFFLWFVFLGIVSFLCLTYPSIRMICMYIPHLYDLRERARFHSFLFLICTSFINFYFIILIILCNVKKYRRNLLICTYIHMYTLYIIRDSVSLLYDSSDSSLYVCIRNTKASRQLRT